MKSTVVPAALFAALLTSFTLASMDVRLLGDDFDSTTLDSDDWTVQADSGCTVAVVDEQLECYFQGGATAKSAYAVSRAIKLPAGWTAITITGRWKVTAKDTGEFRIRLSDVITPANYIVCSYATWTTYRWDHFRAVDSLGYSHYTARTIPSAYVDFRIQVSSGGWQYYENDVLIDGSTNAPLASASQVALTLGGWDASAAGVETVWFNDVMVSVQAPVDELMGCSNPAVLKQAPYHPADDSIFEIVDEEFDSYILENIPATQAGVADKIEVWGFLMTYDLYSDTWGVAPQRDRQFAFRFYNEESYAYVDSYHLGTCEATGVSYYWGGLEMPLCKFTIPFWSEHYYIYPGYVRISATTTDAGGSLFCMLSSPDGDGVSWLNYYGSGLVETDWNWSMCVCREPDLLTEPYFLSPTEACKHVSLTPMLTWDCTAPEGTVYDVYMGASFDPYSPSYSLIASDVNEKHLTVTPELMALPMMNYVGWKVVSRYDGESHESDYASFYTRWQFGDLDLDDNVSPIDFALFMHRWLDSGCDARNEFCSGADADYDKDVDFRDYAALAANWLYNVAEMTNDTCQTATTLNIPLYSQVILYDQNTFFADGTDISSCGTNDSYDVWYYIANTAGTCMIFIAGSDSSSFDENAIISVYDGCGGAQVACSKAEVQFTIAAGHNYVFRVAGENNTRGAFILMAIRM